MFCFCFQLAALRCGEDTSRMLMNKVLFWKGVMFEPQDDEVTGVWRKLYNYDLQNLYSWPNSIRMFRLRVWWVGRIARVGQVRNTYQDFDAEAEGKRLFGRSVMDGRIIFKWIVLLDVVEWIYLTEGRVQWRLWGQVGGGISLLEGRLLFLKQELVLVNRQCDCTESAARYPASSVSLSSVWLHWVGCKMPCFQC